MSALVRTASGPFTLKDCLSFEEIEEKVSIGELQGKLLKIEDALSFFEKVTVDGITATQVMNGMVLPLPKGIDENKFSIYNGNGECIAIYIKHPTKLGLMKPEKILKNDVLG